MSEQIVILKNLLSENYLIDDMGYYIEADSTVSLSDQFTFAEICNSNDLKDLVSDGTSLTINNGIVDLSIDETLDQLSRENIYDVRDKHYTKTSMQTSGESILHQDNLKENPQIKPVKYRIKAIDTTAPADSTIGDVYFNSVDDKYYKHDGTTYNYLVDVSIDDRVIDNSIINEPIYTQNGSAFELTTTPVKNNSIIVEDDGDGKRAHYVYTGTIQTKIGDVDFDDRINELQSAIDLINYNLVIIDGVFYARDEDRGRYLSPRQSYIFSRGGNAKNTYLLLGDVLTNKNSIHLDADYRLVTATVELSENTTDATIHVRKNDLSIDVISFVITSGKRYEDTTLNILLDKGDFIEIFCSGDGAKDPVVNIVLARDGGAII